MLVSDSNLFSDSIASLTLEKYYCRQIYFSVFLNKIIFKTITNVYIFTFKRLYFDGHSFKLNIFVNNINY